MSNSGHVQICCLLLIILVRHVACQNTNFSFPNFNSTDPRFIMLGDAASMDSSMYLNNKYYTYNVSHSCGRFMYPDSVRMYDPPTGQVASFNTSFTFEIMLHRAVNAVDGTYMNGDGFAFTITPDTTTVDATGEILCNTKTFADTRIFAVEIDTWLTLDDNDLSDSHIAIDLNSAFHSWLFPEYVHNLCQDSPGNTSYCGYFANNPGPFTVWVDYDGTVIEVRFSSGLDAFKPASPIIVAAPNLRLELNEFTYVGFSGSFGDYKEVHRILSWSFSSSGLQSSSPSPQPALSPAPSPQTALSPTPEAIASRSNNNVGLISGIVSGILGATIMVLGSIFILRRRRKKFNQGKDSSSLKLHLMGPRIFTYRELSKATKEFSDSVLIGSGGFGAVYKGTLQPSGALVAVKRCSRPDKAHAEEGFVAEATSISQIRHRNLVQLQGWCQERGQLLLVYDYMPNRSLDEWLFNREIHGILTWELRYNILAGVAAALAYLHEEWQQCVLHRDIKASNVMLDGEFNAHLGDFGLARLIDHRKAEKTTEMAGTLGYMAPEMYYTGKATKESDVYSFGVLILEVSGFLL